MNSKRPRVGIIGGSGFYGLFDKTEELEIETPYGNPSDKIEIGAIDKVDVAFLPRHGKKHSFPPHSIPYRANLYALHKLGVERVIGPSAAGSLNSRINPGDFVIADQFVNLTNGRKDTFYDGPETIHIGTSEPYCPELRKKIISSATSLGLTVHSTGTVAVIQGPRFSTKAESRFFSKQGWDVINMTQYPEATLARELQMCYANISLITDHDVGLEGDASIKAVSSEMVAEIFKKNNFKLKQLLTNLIPEIPEKRSCSCSSSLNGARI